MSKGVMGDPEQKGDLNYLPEEPAPQAKAWVVTFQALPDGRIAVSYPDGLVEFTRPAADVIPFKRQDDPA